MEHLYLYLIRHGRTDWNAQRRYQGQTDTKLDDEGRRQADLLARRLAASDVAFDALYSSDLSRTMETARPISAATGLAIHPTPALREMAFGVVEGLTYDEMTARYPEQVSAWFADPNYPLAGGERYDDFSARLAGFITGIRQTHLGQTVILVTHGGPIREILRQVFGLPMEQRWVFSTENTSLAELKLYENGQARLIRLNDICHLHSNGRP